MTPSKQTTNKAEARISDHLAMYIPSIYVEDTLQVAYAIDFATLQTHSQTLADALKTLLAEVDQLRGVFVPNKG